MRSLKLGILSAGFVALLVSTLPAAASPNPVLHPAMLPRPSTGDRSLGSTAPVTGVVSGATGAAAIRAAGPAATAFAALNSRRQHAQTHRSPADQLHTDWGIYPPSSGANGLVATQSVLPNTVVGGGDFLYAPTAKSPGNSCIELTTAYDSDGPLLWAWDWCGSIAPGKTVAMDSSFLSTYTTLVNGRPAYTMDESQTDPATNAWTIYLYNYANQSWDVFYTSSGTDKSGFSFGWDTYEVYTSVNPSTGAGYFCDATHGSAVESSNIQLYQGSWTPATSGNAPLSSTPPPGSDFDCPSLNFSVASPNNDWIAANN